MLKERFNFAYLNHTANSIDGIAHIKVPFLGVFGDSDLNVDVVNSMDTYKTEFDQVGKKNYELHLIKHASHELLNAKYNHDKNQLPLHAFIKGDGIYADGAIDLLIEWLNANFKIE
jgi:hypothetical protein